MQNAPMKHVRGPAFQRPVPLVSWHRPGVVFPKTPAATSEAVTGLVHLSDEAKARALDKKTNKFEKVKAEKCGSNMWKEVHELASLIREGKTKWEDLNLDDVDIRLKWAGLFHRGKRTPGKFMMRLRVPNGELNAKQLRTLASCIKPYGDDGCADITTRANIQLRGVTITEADTVINSLMAVGITSVMSGMDNVRNFTGNPIAGIDPHELVDTRPICQELQDVITNKGQGRADLTNLPRKINICVSSTRDDFPHTHINDVGFEAVKHPATGEVLFNVVVGGYFSIKRNIMSIPLGVSVTQAQLVPFSEALMKVFRDHGGRGDRQQARLIWLIESVGMPRFIELVEQMMGAGVKLAPAVHVHHEEKWERRDLLGVHPQKQAGLFWVGACVPAGRLHAADFDEIARLAETYGDGSVRLTCEENVLFVNVPEDKVAAMLEEPLLQRFKVFPGQLERGLVSCTGSQFCGFGLMETKNRAMAMIAKLEAELEMPRPVRIHWTGCPNSCGQAQVGDIGLMGAPAKLNGKACEGVKLFLGGSIGENPTLASEFESAIPADEAHLLPKLREVLTNHFGAVPITSSSPPSAAAPGQPGETPAPRQAVVAAALVVPLTHSSDDPQALDASSSSFPRITLPTSASSPAGASDRALAAGPSAGAVSVSAVLSPAATFAAVVNAGALKAEMPGSQALVMGVLSGAYIALGGFLVVTLTGSLAGAIPPGLIKLLAGIVFPYGLMMSVICGGELFTGNTAFMAAALYEKRASAAAVLRNLSAAYMGNLIGSLAVVSLVVASGLVVGNAVPATMAAVKSSLPWHQAFLRGVLCNWLVCAGVWQAASASSLPGKVLGLWIPVTAFVVLNLEHCVANMFYIPLGLANGATTSVLDFLTRNLLPVTLGNILGGVLCMATAYSLAFGRLGGRQPQGAK